MDRSESSHYFQRQLFKNLDKLLMEPSTSRGAQKAVSSTSGKISAKKGITDKVLIEHANSTVAEAAEDSKSGKIGYVPLPGSEARAWLQLRLKSFSDDHLSNSHYLACLLWATAKVLSSFFSEVWCVFGGIVEWSVLHDWFLCPRM